MPRTGLVLEALLPAILEQRVLGVDARSSWRWLVCRYGTPPPGRAPSGMRRRPSPEAWLTIPSGDWHRAGVDVHPPACRPGSRGGRGRAGAQLSEHSGDPAPVYGWAANRERTLPVVAFTGRHPQLGIITPLSEKETVPPQWALESDPLLCLDRTPATPTR